MQLDILDSILVIANPVIVIVQCVIYSKLLSSKDKMITKCFEDRYELLKEHFQYRIQVNEEKIRDEKKLISNISAYDINCRSERP